ncbi:MAG: hypothetical protein V1821_01115, partial [bacterium]
GDNSSLLYETAAVLNRAHQIVGSEWIENSHDIHYSDSCVNCSDLLGCVGLRNKQYCILNKQYSQSGYEALKATVIQGMKQVPYIDSRGRSYFYGDFLPAEFSLFAYNDAIISEYFPLKPEEAAKEGYHWAARMEVQHEPTLLTADLPHIGKASSEITREIIPCALRISENCSQVYRILPQELELLRTVKIALPRACPTCRHYVRAQARNPLKLWPRSCVCAGAGSKDGAYRNLATHAHGEEPCQTKFQTTYAPDRPEIVYCEECYREEIE